MRDSDINDVNVAGSADPINIKQFLCPGDKDCGKVFLFLDENDNHQFDGGDTVYEVRAGGGFTPFTVMKHSYLDHEATGSCDTLCGTGTCWGVIVFGYVEWTGQTGRTFLHQNCSYEVPFEYSGTIYCYCYR